MENAISANSEQRAFKRKATAFDSGPLMHSIVYMRQIVRKHSEETLHLTVPTVLEVCLEIKHS